MATYRALGLPKIKGTSGHLWCSILIFAYFTHFSNSNISEIRADIYFPNGERRFNSFMKFYVINLNQISMIVQIIPVRTTRSTQTEATDSTEAALAAWSLFAPQKCTMPECVSVEIGTQTHWNHQNGFIGSFDAPWPEWSLILIQITSKERTLRVWKNNVHNYPELRNFNASKNIYLKTSCSLWTPHFDKKSTRDFLSFQSRVSKAACNLFQAICHIACKGFPA